MLSPVSDIRCSGVTTTTEWWHARDGVTREGDTLFRVGWQVPPPTSVGGGVASGHPPWGDFHPPDLDPPLGDPDPPRPPAFTPPRDREIPPDFASAERMQNPLFLSGFPDPPSGGGGPFLTP